MVPEASWFSKNCHLATDVPRKVEKTSSDITTFSFSSWNRSFRCGRPLKSRKNVKRKHCFWKFGAPLSHLRLFRLIFLSLRFLPYVIFALKTCIPFVAVPKKSKKRQAKTSLLKIRSTPIALAALPVDLSSFLIFQFSIKNLSFRCGLSQQNRKKRQAKTPRCHFLFWNLSFRCERPLKSRKNVKRKHCF